MSTQKIPNNRKQIVQSNQGDYQGNIWSTFNIDLDSNPGTIKAAPRLDQVIGSSEIGTDIVQALQIHDGRYYLTTNDRVLSCLVSNDPTDSSNWLSIATLALKDLGLESDTTSFEGLLLISLDTDVMSWDGSAKDDDWWTSSAGGGVGTALTANYTHTMEVLRTGQDTLFVTDKNVVRYVNTTAGHTSITLDELMIANCLAPSLDRMWAGTYTEVQDKAHVYELRVGDSAALQSYEVDGRVCLTMFTYRNTPFVVTEKGYVQVFNGAGFQTIAQFPWATESKIMEGCRPGLVQDSPTSRAIHPKGSKVVGKYAYIYVNADNEFVTNENLNTRSPSGVWVLDLETYSLTHKYALTEASTDKGSHKVDRSGPLLLVNSPQTRIMVGGDVETPGVWMEGSTTPLSYFTTVRHESDSVTDAFEAFYVKADTLDSSESIALKYKDTTVPNFPYLVNDITWYDSTSFTTTDALTGVAVGDEIEILAGHYAGNLCHITAIEGDTTKTVTVDETFGTLNEQSDIQIDKWKKHKTTMTSDDGEVKRFGSGETAPSRQYKVVLNGDITVREVISKSNNKNTT